MAIKIKSTAGGMEIRGNGADIEIKISGPLDIGNAGARLDQWNRFFVGRASLRRVSLDLSAVNFMDTYGALTIQKLRHAVTQSGGQLALIGVLPEVEGMIALTGESPAKAEQWEIEAEDKPAKARPAGLNELFAAFGHMILTKSGVMAGLLDFLGKTLIAGVDIIRRPASMRWGDVFFTMRRVGVEALPIVGLISFLLGLIIAFMSAVQLKQFGANIYVASLVGLGMTRELAPIITCIIMAGRSGAAFAAEIGTMKVSREMDALTTMGFNLTRFLVMPKVIAAVAMVPFLTLFSDVLAVLGGMVVGVTMLDLTVDSYVNQLRVSVGLYDIGLGIFKSMVFALLIAWAGCYCGLQVRGGADAVGLASTRAVVSGIFLVIVCDAVFAVVQRYVG